MLKIVPSLLLSVLLVGALVLDTSSACPYMLQKIDQVDSPAIGTASSHHTARTLHEGDTDFISDSLLFVIINSIIQFIANIFNFLFGRGDDTDNGFVFNSTPFVGSIDDALTAAREDIIGFMDAPKFVRLAFHDCVGGQCDGCVDTSIPDNFGLDEPIQDLQPIVNKYAAQMTRADLWVLAGLTAAEVAQTAGRGGNNNPVVLFPMQYVNRASCDDPQGGPARSVPSSHFDTNQTLDFFASNFDFSDEETVAILGAHTLYVGAHGMSILVSFVPRF